MSAATAGHPQLTDAMSLIIRSVCATFGVTQDELFSTVRRGRFADPRQIAWLLLRKHSHWSVTEISSLFGKRNHSCVAHGIKAVKRRLAVDPELAGRLKHITDEIGPWLPGGAL